MSQAGLQPKWWDWLKHPALIKHTTLWCPLAQVCVSRCPDRFATFSEMQQQFNVSKKTWEYYRQFCKPDFNNPEKVLRTCLDNFIWSFFHIRVCLSNIFSAAFTQPVSEVLRDDDCPSVIYPSRPGNAVKRQTQLLTRIKICARCGGKYVLWIIIIIIIIIIITDKEKWAFMGLIMTRWYSFTLGFASFSFSEVCARLQRYEPDEKARRSRSS